jgi:hypothetical protein
MDHVGVLDVLVEGERGAGACPKAGRRCHDAEDERCQADEEERE